MKNSISSILLLAALSLASVSCEKFLTSDEGTFTSREFQFRSFDNCKKVATNVYTYIRTYEADVDGTMREAATDNAIYTWQSNGVRRYFNGTWSDKSAIDDVWGHYYAGIRAASFFLENAPDEFPLAKYSDNYEKHVEELANYKREVRALRAYFHFELVKRYNRIPIVNRCLSAEEVNSLAPVSYSAAVDSIVAELDAVIPELPVTYEHTLSGERGRVTRGAAMAIKARALLYAASPLNNPENDPAKWLRAAQAASEIINDKELGYKLQKENDYNNENALGLIFGVRQMPSNSFEYTNFPAMFVASNHGGILPSYNLFEAFDCADGTPFVWESDQDILLNSDKRDPRMKRTIICNGDTFKDVVITSYKAGKNRITENDAVNTSFFLRKLIAAETSLKAGAINSFTHVIPLYRYAEVYLNYAEALFEATGDMNKVGKIDGVPFTMSPLDALNKVRTRCGQNKLSAGPRIKGGKAVGEVSNETFRELLHNERRVELAFEDHRFWDVRRWKEGESYDLNSLVITWDKKNNVAKSVERQVLETREWDDRYYFYPIPISEIYRNRNLVQNTGW